MEPARRFQDLVMWQKSHALTLRTYRLTTTYPKHEIYGLVCADAPGGGLCLGQYCGGILEARQSG